MSTNFKDYLNEQMKDPAFRAEYEALAPECSGKRMPEHIEDEHDLKVLLTAMREHRANPVTFPLDEVEKELGYK